MIRGAEKRKKIKEKIELENGWMDEGERCGYLQPCSEIPR
jgi:hypothetical protein